MAQFKYACRALSVAWYGHRGDSKVWCVEAGNHFCSPQHILWKGDLNGELLWLPASLLACEYFLKLRMIKFCLLKCQVITWSPRSFSDYNRPASRWLHMGHHKTEQMFISLWENETLADASATLTRKWNIPPLFLPTLWFKRKWQLLDSMSSYKREIVSRSRKQQQQKTSLHVKSKTVCGESCFRLSGSFVGSLQGSFNSIKIDFLGFLDSL